MKINEDFPMVVFDNQCYLCVKFAKFVDFFARGKMKMVGHYSEEGKNIDYQKLSWENLAQFPYYY